MEAASGQGRLRAEGSVTLTPLLRVISRVDYATLEGARVRETDAALRVRNDVARAAPRRIGRHSVVAEGHDWIDADGTARRKIAGEQRDQHQDCRRRGQRNRIPRRDADEL